MERETNVAGFLAISELYFKMTEQSEKVILENEIELLISRINNSNLSMSSIDQIS